jgi:hypothetical protein
VAEVGGCSLDPLADHQVAAAIHEGHPFDRQGQEGDGGVGPEPGLAGQAQAGTGGIQSGLGLEAAGGGSMGADGVDRRWGSSADNALDSNGQGGSLTVFFRII